MAVVGIADPEWLASLFQRALPEAAAAGKVAVGVGALGLLWGVTWALLYERDRSRAKHAPDATRPSVFPRSGPCQQALGTLISDPSSYGSLSPDAASEVVAARLAAQQESLHSVARFLSYAPLLVGLLGTILSLQRLLVDSGRTLQEIQPELGGAFVGTLAGILGSLVANLGGLTLDVCARRAIHKVEDYVRRHVLPMLPEQRIALRIEEAVLERITEKAQFAVEGFKSALEPVSASLEATATRSAQAASEASRAFGEAAQAVREAGSLEGASRNMRIAAHALDSAAAYAQRAAQVSGENQQRLEAFHSKLDALAERIGAASNNLSKASDGLVEAVQESSARLSDNLSHISASTQALGEVTARSAEEIAKRANLDTDYLKAIELQVAAAADLLVVLRDAASGIETALAAIPRRLLELSESLSDGVQREIRDGMEGLLDRLSKVLNGIVPVLDEAVRCLADTISQVKGEHSALGAQTPAYVEAMDRASAATRQLAEQLPMVTRGVSELHRLLAEGNRDGEPVRVKIMQPELTSSPGLVTPRGGKGQGRSNSPRKDRSLPGWWPFRRSR